MRSIFKFYKKQTKSENHETCQDVKISYVEAVIKICGGFTQVVTYDACKSKSASSIYHVRCLQTEVSQKKNRSVEKDSVRFGVKVTIELGLTSKLLYRQ